MQNVSAAGSSSAASLSVKAQSQGSWAGFARYLRRNPSLVIGSVLVLSLVLFSVFGALFYDLSKARPISVMPGMAPSGEYPFGTDNQGRDLFAVMVAGTPLTLQIGLIAGFIGVFIGTILAFVAAYYGGWVDNLIKGLVDVLLTIPGLLIQIGRASCMVRVWF